MPDPYIQAADFMTRLEAALREANLWPGEKPAGPIEVEGAFGSRNMAFEQWLAWVLIPRVRQIIADRDEFPQSSEVAAYAVREFDTTPNSEGVVEVLSEFDAFVNKEKP